jgi:hypothetical protein
MLQSIFLALFYGATCVVAFPRAGLDKRATASVPPPLPSDSSLPTVTIPIVGPSSASPTGSPGNVSQNAVLLVGFEGCSKKSECGPNNDQTWKDIIKQSFQDMQRMIPNELEEDPGG